MKLIGVADFAAMFLLVSSFGGDLQAYLDPGTGSVALQVILGGAIAALATVRLYWDRMKQFLHRPRVDGDSTSEQR